MQVCVEFLSLSLVSEGYTVYVNHEACGTFTERVARESLQRIRVAGAHIVSQFGITTDLMRDWRNTPGAKELFPYYDQCVHAKSEERVLTQYCRYLPAYGLLARGHLAATEHGEVQPGEADL
jgi:hypothetical protein